MIFNSLQKKTWPPVAYERGGPTPKALGGLGFRCKLLNLRPITIKSKIYSVPLFKKYFSY